MMEVTQHHHKTEVRWRKWRKFINVTYISVSAPENFVQQIAKLPADHGVAGQRQIQDVGPEGGGSTLFVRSYDDIFTAVKETSKI